MRQMFINILIVCLPRENTFSFKYQENLSIFSEQEFSELFGLVPHRANEESNPNHHFDVDNDKVNIKVKTNF